MKMTVLLVALGLVVPLAGRAHAKKYNEFQLKEMHQARDERREEKTALKEDQADEQAEADRHARAVRMQHRSKDDDPSYDRDVDSDSE